MRLDKLGITPGEWKVVNADRENPKVHQLIGQGKSQVIIKNDISKNDLQLMASSPEMLEALIWFCIRTENGSVRSMKTYSKYVGIIERATGRSWREVKELIQERKP